MFYFYFIHSFSIMSTHALTWIYIKFHLLYYRKIALYVIQIKQVLYDELKIQLFILYIDIFDECIY